MYTAGLLNAAQMVLKGCTAAYDVYSEFPRPSLEGLSAVGQAYSEVGVRVVLRPARATARSISRFRTCWTPCRRRTAPLSTKCAPLRTRNTSRPVRRCCAIGRLRPGDQADMVFLDLTNVNFVALNDIANQIVHCEDSSAVDSAMIGGRVVLASRQFTTFDYDNTSGH